MLRIFENIMTRKILGPQGTEGCKSIVGRKQHNYELHGFFSKINIILVTKSRTMTPVVHVARNGEEFHIEI